MNWVMKLMIFRRPYRLDTQINHMLGLDNLQTRLRNYVWRDYPIIFRYVVGEGNNSTKKEMQKNDIYVAKS